MSGDSEQPRCGQTELMPLYVLRALTSDEMRFLEAHVTDCQECQREVQALCPVVDSRVSWPTDMLRPADSVWTRLQERVGGDSKGQSVVTDVTSWQEAEWEDVAPGISCKLLATDTARERVSMLVRLAPDTAYPPHRHAGVEELFLLHGELWIEDRKLHPGDYNRGEPGTADKRVWSGTGCTCVLITSFRDIIS